MKLYRFEDSTKNREYLFRFYDLVYPNSPWLHDVNRFEWQSLLNPHLEKGKTEIWLLLDDDGEIVGQNIFALYEMSIGGKIQLGYCSTNLVLSPTLVGKGLGHRFIELNESRRGVAYAVGITLASTRAFLKFGWVHHTDARLLTLMVHPMPNLSYLKIPFWKKLTAYFPLKVLSFLSRVVLILNTPKMHNGLSYHEISSFEPKHDQLWNEFLSGYAIHFQRSSTILNYKYSQRTDVKHTKLIFEANGQPVGYLVIRISVNPIHNLRLGRIVDFVFDPNYGSNLLPLMISVATRLLLKSNVDALVVVASDARIRRIFFSCGFFLSRVQPAIIKLCQLDLDDLRRKYPSLWYITLGDSDLDNYW